MMDGKVKWDRVMALAERGGFIITAFGGVAVLATHDIQKKEGIFEHTQWRNGVGPLPEDDLPPMCGDIIP